MSFLTFKKKCSTRPKPLISIYLCRLENAPRKGIIGFGGIKQRMAAVIGQTAGNQVKRGTPHLSSVGAEAQPADTVPLICRLVGIHTSS